jgi:SAM-dependent methyltransferase
MTLRYEDVLDNLRAWYDGEAPHRDGMVKQQFKLDERAAFLDRLQVVEASSLLDVGAGTGQDSVYFRDAGLAVTAVDLSPEMVRRCREKGIDAVVRDVKRLEFPAASFDGVWAMNCLLHVPDADLPEALREIRRVLRPGGLFYVGQWGGARDEGIRAQDQRFFAHRSDEQLFTAVHEAFEVIDVHALEDEGHHFQAVTAVRPLSP